MRKAIVLLLAFVVIVGMTAEVTALGSADPTCSGSLPNRLTIGMRGQIAERFSTLRVKPGGPGVTVAAPAQFTVLEAPQCAANGPLWWLHIRYDNGQQGWASESQRFSIYGIDHYWLEPVVEESAG